MTTGFTKRVAIQEGIPTRDSAGGVHHDTFQNLAGLSSVPATLTPTIDEKRQERFTEDNEMWEIILGGHYPQINQTHYVLHDGTRYEIKRVSTTKRQRVTTLLARNGSITADDLGAAP